LYWTRFVDLAVGFEARHYEPISGERDDRPRQALFLGLAINMQGVVDHLFQDSVGRRVAHGTFEVLAPPFSTFRFAETARYRNAPF
jgi:hypothetical protein